MATAGLLAFPMRKRLLGVKVRPQWHIAPAHTGITVARQLVILTRFPIVRILRTVAFSRCKITTFPRTDKAKFFKVFHICC